MFNLINLLGFYFILTLIDGRIFEYPHSIWCHRKLIREQCLTWDRWVMY